jgi:hypothetical protein
MKRNILKVVNKRISNTSAATCNLLCLLITLLWGVSGTTFSQEILLSSIHDAKNDISAREHEYIDANGDASAIIKARIGLKELSYSTDRGINKIEQRDGEVWLWVPPGTNSLSIITEKGDTITTTLPVALSEYSVCIVLFTLKLSPQTEYKELPILSIKSSVKKTDVFINDIYQGIAPITLSLYPDTFAYRIEKPRYHTIVGSEVMKAEGSELVFNMKKSDTTNRFFVSIITDGIFRFQNNWGVTIGMLGRTGWYGSYSSSLQKQKQDYSLDSPEANLNFNTYHLQPSDPMKLIINYTMLNLGLTSPVFSGSPVFFNAGLSWAKSRCYQYFDKVFYNNDLPTETIMVYRTDKYFIANGLDAGVFIRFKNQFLLSLNSSSFFDRIREWDPVTDTTEKYFKYTTTNYKVGIGYNF